MSINSAIENQINSVRSAMNMATLQTAMNQNGAAVNKLLEGMEETTEAVKNAQNTPSHIGNNVDIRV